MELPARHIHISDLDSSLQSLHLYSTSTARSKNKAARRARTRGSRGAASISVRAPTFLKQVAAMSSTPFLFCLAFALASFTVASSGNVPESACGHLSVKYTQVSEQLEQYPPLLQHLTSLFQSAKTRLDDAQAELAIRQSKHKDCKVLEPDEQGWVPPDVCRLTLEPEIQGYQVIIEDNQKLMSNMSPSIQAAEVHQAELARDLEDLRSRLAAQGCPLDWKMSPAKHVAAETKTEI